MTEHKKYILMVRGKPVEVSYEVYYEYHRMDRRDRYLEERDMAHGKTLYSNPDTSEVLGEEMLSDRNAVSTEDAAIAHILYEKLHLCLDMLSEGDRKLLHAVFFDEVSLRQLSEQEHIPVMTLQSRKSKAIEQLRKIFLKK